MRKITLYAYDDPTTNITGFIRFREDIISENWHYKRRPEFDIEKEIEVPDEVKKPREFWIAQGSHADIVLYSEEEAIRLGWSKPYINVIEKLPDHVMVSRCQLELAWKKHFTDYAGPIYKAFCKELGLGDE